MLEYTRIVSTDRRRLNTLVDALQMLLMYSFFLCRYIISAMFLNKQHTNQCNYDHFIPSVVC